MRVLIIENHPGPLEKPWWLEYVRACATEKRITIDVESIQDSFRFSLRLPLWKIFRLLRAGRRYDWVITYQDGISTICFGLVRRMFPEAGPRHAVLEFLTREKGSSFYDRLKYAFLRFCLRDIDRITCSSRHEAKCYQENLNLRSDQVVFIPLAGDPGWILEPPDRMGDYIVSAGRTFRDYTTLIRAVGGSSLPLIIVTSPRCLAGIPLPSNVRAHFDIEQNRLLELIRGARFVVLPLQDRAISCGQRVLLMAMALGKCCVATRTPGLLDYITSGEDGIFVEPNDATALRAVISKLAADANTVTAIGQAARRAFEARFRIERYARLVLGVLERADGQPRQSQ